MDFKKLSKDIQDFARPYLTVLIATVFNLLLAIAYFRGDLGITEYITSVGPTNAMIIGFWFGERAALKVPGNVEKKDDPDPN